MFKTCIIWLFCCLNLQLVVHANGKCTDETKFEGFGAFLGKVTHFARLENGGDGVIEKVIDAAYNDLGLRYFRTSYEPEFSTAPNVYNISCSSPYACSYLKVMDEFSKYQNTSLFASIWTPPAYMKNPIFETLEEEHELDFYYFIKNVTKLVKEQWNVDVERVSPVNEPENLFAPWAHTNMGPKQMCRMLSNFSDSLVALCPENSYYWMSELYTNYTDPSTGVKCADICDIFATHGYTLNIDLFSPNHLRAYYDPARYNRSDVIGSKPIWMTEVSSTYSTSTVLSAQMSEALDLASHIIDSLVGTCAQRYYFWLLYTNGASGESLIWGMDSKTGELSLPKKYFAFKHFTSAAFGKTVVIKELEFLNTAGQSDLIGIAFGEDGKIVLVNKSDKSESVEIIHQCQNLCCTTLNEDWNCLTMSFTSNRTVQIPPESVCSC